LIKDFAKKEEKLLEEIVESEHMIAHLEELVVKKGQSSQTMHMIANQTNPIYHTKNKMALGNKTPCNLKKAQQEQNVLYNGNVIYTKHDPPVVRDSVETIELVKETFFRESLLFHKQNHLCFPLNDHLRNSCLKRKLFPNLFLN
jgi:hypothetical protein